MRPHRHHWALLRSGVLMVWFKVDDKLHDHRKARQAGVAAMGLWLLAGSWSSDNLTDGFVPESVLSRWERNYGRLVSRLVDAELWVPESQHGEKGYRFHDWEKQNPTRSDVQKEREHARARMANVRAMRKARSAEQQANVREKFAGSSESVRLTRPDPTRPVVPSELENPLPPSAKSSRGSRLPDDWQPSAELVAWVRAECPTIDHRAETENFRDWWHAKAGRDSTKMDWDLTYKMWMRRTRTQTAKPQRGEPRYFNSAPNQMRIEI